jgi:hypothetical protein
MRMMFRAATLACGLAFLNLTSCNGTLASDDDGGQGGLGGDSGGEPPVGPCGVTEGPGLELGEGSGPAFESFHDGDELRLQFSSQSGMEVAFSIRGSSVALAEVVSVEAALMVGEFPVGVASTSGESCRCADDFVSLDTAILIDVSLHPDVRSVAQLVTLDAELVVELRSASGLIVAHSVQVDLEQ